ncbi:MAG: YDG domain-containing protein [Treponema sp.]|nr:YDG domain-containing protein [Treponema sp.]
MKIITKVIRNILLCAILVSASCVLGGDIEELRDIVISNTEAQKLTPVASDFDVINLTQTIGSIVPVEITPREGKTTGAITVLYNGFNAIPSATGTYTVTFNVAGTAEWQAVNGLAGGTLTINLHNQNPAATDFNISNMTQAVGNIVPVTITPKTGKSAGMISVYYAGSAALPSSIGTYIVTFDVAQAAGWNAVNGLIAGILIISDKINVQIPIITSQPMDAVITINTAHSLSVTVNVTDNGMLSYQWYSNTSASNTGGSVITGATSSSYNPPTGTSGTYHYFVEITNAITDNGDGGNKSATVRSNAASLNVNTKENAQTPNITSQPTDGNVIFGGSSSLSVTANVTDGGTLSYQWYSNTSESNTGGSIITGAVSSSYSPPANTAGTYYYFAEIINTITDNGDGGNKSAHIRSNAVSFIVNIQVDAHEPNITNQPMNATVTIGTSHSLTVTTSVIDGGTLSYQWYSNTNASNTGGTVIPGATSSSFNPPAGIAGTYYYFAEITNTIADNGDGGNKNTAVRSNAVTLIVNNQTPAATDFNIGNMMQTYGNTTNVSIAPKFGKTTGDISILYNGLKDHPTAPGSYAVTFNVTAATGWNAVTWLEAGTLTVNRKTINITGVSALNRLYNGTTIVELSGGNLTGVITGDDVGFTLGNGTITNAAAGNSKAVTTNIQLTGNSKDNYTLIQPAGLTVNITAQENFSISFADFSDINTPSITVNTIYLNSGAGKPASAQITVDNPQQYDSGSIKWYLNRNQITSGITGSFGQTLTVNSTVYNKIGTYTLMAEVKINGRMYSKNVIFEVKP